MTGTIHKLDQSGHGTVATWAADAESRKAGAAAFADLIERGFTLFDITDPLAGRKIQAFDPEAGEIIAVPRMVGG